MKTKKILWAAALISTMAACRKIEKIEKSGTVKSKLVVNCIAGYPGGIDGLYFDVSKSLSAIDNAPIKTFKYAKIEITTGSGLKETVLYDAIEDTYFTKTIKIIAGETYNMKATAPGLDPVSATMQFPKIIGNFTVSFQAKGIKYYTEPSTNWYQKRMESATIKLSFEDSDPAENSYILQIQPKWASGKSWYNTLGWQTNRPNTEHTVGGYGAGENWFFTDGFDNGKTIDLEFTTSNSYLEVGNLTDSIIGFEIELKHVNPDLSKYWYTIQKAEENQDNPFEEPVQIYSNIQGGYGIFGGFITRVKTVPFQ